MIFANGSDNASVTSYSISVDNFNLPSTDDLDGDANDASKSYLSSGCKKEKKKKRKRKKKEKIKR